MSLALSIRRSTTGGPSTVDKTFTGGDRYVGQWDKGLVSALHAPHLIVQLASIQHSVLCMWLHLQQANSSNVMLLQPEGEGKYVWTDQSTYEGGWKVQLTCLNLCLSPI